jgi:hypothetical protein
MEIGLTSARGRQAASFIELRGALDRALIERGEAPGVKTAAAYAVLNAAIADGRERRPTDLALTGAPLSDFDFALLEHVTSAI